MRPSDMVKGLLVIIGICIGFGLTVGFALYHLLTWGLP